MHRTQKEILQSLRRGRWTPTKTILGHVSNASYQDATYHLKQLKSAGLVEKQKKGRVAFYTRTKKKI